MKVFRLFNTVIILSLVISCNDEIELEFPPVNDKIVIDGWIEQGTKARVLLTSNFPYFSKFDSTSIRELILTRAKVTISCGDRSETMTLTKDERYFPPYVYESTDIKGEIGKTYKITAEYGGKIAYAQTSIPEPVEIDTAYFIKNETSDSSGVLFVEFTDPPAKNYYRIFSRIINEEETFIPANVSALDDIFFNGGKFGFSLSRSSENFLLEGENQFFQKGQTVVIKLCTIDEPHFEFWSSFMDEVLNANNPFAASLTEVKSNIKGDGLGIWGGYGVSTMEITIE